MQFLGRYLGILFPRVVVSACVASYDMVLAYSQLGTLCGKIIILIWNGRPNRLSFRSVQWQDRKERNETILSDRK